MAVGEMNYLHDELQERKHRLETAIALTPQDPSLPTPTGGTKNLEVALTISFLQP